MPNLSAEILWSFVLLFLSLGIQHCNGIVSGKTYIYIGSLLASLLQTSQNDRGY